MDDLTYKIYLAAFTAKLAGTDIVGARFSADNMQHVAAVAYGLACASRPSPMLVPRSKLASELDALMKVE